MKERCALARALKEGNYYCHHLSHSVKAGDISIKIIIRDAPIKALPELLIKAKYVGSPQDFTAFSLSRLISSLCTFLKNPGFLH